MNEKELKERLMLTDVELAIAGDKGYREFAKDMNSMPLAQRVRRAIADDATSKALTTPIPRERECEKCKGGGMGLFHHNRNARNANTTHRQQSLVGF